MTANDGLATYNIIDIPTSRIREDLAAGRAVRATFTHRGHSIDLAVTEVLPDNRIAGTLAAPTNADPKMPVGTRLGFPVSMLSTIYVTASH